MELTVADQKKVEILQNKINHKLTENVEKVTKVVGDIENDSNLLEDNIITLGSNNLLDFHSNGNLKMSWKDKDVLTEEDMYSLHPHALSQLATKFSIPTAYVRKLTEEQWGRDLLKDILKEHSINIGRNRILVRSVGNETRAVLSDRYKRVDSIEVMKKFLYGCQQNNAFVWDAHYSETKTWLSAIIPKVYTIPTENNGLVHSVFGAQLSNSDFGDGALALKATQINVACLNGMTTESLMRKIHLGQKLPDNILFSQKTYELDTRTQASMVEDIMSQVFHEDRILDIGRKIKEASAEEIDLKKEVVKLPKLGLTKEETELVETKLLQNNPDDGIEGKPTKWKLSQAITSVANDIGERRKYEMDDIAGKFLSL